MTEKVKLDFSQPLGSPIAHDYVWKDKDYRELEEVREYDVQKEIDEAAKGMTINEQIARLAYGDLSVLRSGDPVFGDVSQIPENQAQHIVDGLAAAEQMKADAQNNFDKAGEEINKITDPEALAKAQAEYELAKAKLEAFKKGDIK